MTPPLISVCIVASHGSSSLNDCLASLEAQVSPPPFEVLVADNGAVDARSVVGRRFPHAKVCPTGGRLPGAARNPLIQEARGELLLFLDDDVTAPPTMLAHLAGLAARFPEVKVFGGPNDTPPQSSQFQIVQGAVLASIMGAGPVCRRYGARRPGPADERWFTLCNLAVRRSAMLPFAEDLVCAEENAVLAELRRRGAPMRYDPELVAFHERRPSLRGFVKQMFKYGWGRGALMARDPRTARLAYLAPPALLIYLLALPGLVLAAQQGLVAMLPLGLYGALTAASASRIGWTLRWSRAVPVAAALTVLTHLSYGVGLVGGLSGARARAGGNRHRAHPPSAPVESPGSGRAAGSEAA